MNIGTVRLTFAEIASVHTMTVSEIVTQSTSSSAATSFQLLGGVVSAVNSNVVGINPVG